MAAAAQLFDALTPADLPGFDQSIRGGRSWVPYSPEWYQLDPEELRKEHTDTHDLPLWKVLSCHHSGYVREEAVTQLAAVRGGDELPFLLLRLNDWVPVLRSAARRAVEARMTPEYAERYLAHLALVMRLSEAGRENHRETLSRVFSLFNGMPSSKLFATVRELPGKQRRVALELLAETARDLAPLVLESLAFDDPIVQYWGVRLVAGTLPREQAREVLGRMLGGRLATLRREALVSWRTLFPEEADARLHSALMDRNASIRDLARFYLSRQGVDVAAIYREAIEREERPDRLTAAISGLAGVGNAGDGERLVVYLMHPSARVRLEAVKGVARLTDDRHLDLLLARLADTTPRVSSGARRLLTGHLASIGGDTLWQLVVQRGPTHVRRNALYLLAGLRKWDAIPYLIEAAADHDPIIAALAGELVTKWNACFNRSYLSPSRAQIDRLVVALAENRRRFPDVLARQIRFSIQPFLDR